MADTPYQGSPHSELLANYHYEVFTTIHKDQPDYRQRLRQQIAEELAERGLPEAENITNLDARVTHPTLDISASHTEGASLLGWIPKPASIGLDIESKTRITDAIVERVSTAYERSNCPDIRFLWVAKEAAFKALSPKCQVISEIETHSWQKLAEDEYMFSARLPKTGESIDGTGLVHLIPRHFCCLFVIQHKL